jgi:hypothetical protein
MAGQLKVIRKEVETVEYQWAGAFRLRVEVSDPNATGADPRVFLYRRDPVNPYTGETNDTFFAIASVPDLSLYPPGEPDPNTPYPFFRLDYVELDLQSSSIADSLWAVILREINALLQALERLQELVVVDEQFVGTAPTTGNSESSSESSSEST